MIGCVACVFNETCPDAFSEVSQYCGELLDQAQRQYEDALEKIEKISYGITDIETSYPNE